MAIPLHCSSPRLLDLSVRSQPAQSKDMAVHHAAYAHHTCKDFACLTTLLQAFRCNEVWQSASVNSEHRLSLRQEFSKVDGKCRSFLFWTYHNPYQPATMHVQSVHVTGRAIKLAIQLAQE